jgi:hypothetical protein
MLFYKADGVAERFLTVGPAGAFGFCGAEATDRRSPWLPS